MTERTGDSGSLYTLSETGRLGKRSPWKVKAALAAGVGVPMGILLAGDPAAAAGENNGQPQTPENVAEAGSFDSLRPGSDPRVVEALREAATEVPNSDYGDYEHNPATTRDSSDHAAERVIDRALGRFTIDSGFNVSPRSLTLNAEELQREGRSALVQSAKEAAIDALKARRGDSSYWESEAIVRGMEARVIQGHIEDGLALSESRSAASAWSEQLDRSVAKVARMPGRVYHATNAGRGLIPNPKKIMSLLDEEIDDVEVDARYASGLLELERNDNAQRWLNDARKPQTFRQMQKLSRFVGPGPDEADWNGTGGELVYARGSTFISIDESEKPPQVTTQVGKFQVREPLLEE